MMQGRQKIGYVLLFLWGVLLSGFGTVLADPYFVIDSENQWREALAPMLPGPVIRGMLPHEWDAYMQVWYGPGQGDEMEGEPHPPAIFLPPNLELCVGACADQMDHNGGMLMMWGPPDTIMEEGPYASAWVYEYGEDPDLQNVTITVTVTPPLGVGITSVSFAMVDVNGRIRTWWWAVPGVIPEGIATTVTIDTTLTGVGATNPAASGYASDPGFDLSQVNVFTADESGMWVFGQEPVPPPGQIVPRLWNYWANLIVTPKPPPQGGAGKWFIKWSQPPVVRDDGQIYGWDQRSVYNIEPVQIVADDWECKDDRPITDIHWWGSFLGWHLPYMAPFLMPKAFHIGIWTDVIADDPANEFPFSHPGKLIWENYCDNFVWNFAGYDLDPRPPGGPGGEVQEREACFQFTQLLSQNEWFYQKPNPDGTRRIYWLSIAAIYDPDVGGVPNYPWGWKTRPHFFNDDAVVILDTSGPWPPTIGSVMNGGFPIQLPPYPDEGKTWDVAFELTTNRRGPCEQLVADLNHDCIVNLPDFAIMANEWLMMSP